MLHPLRDGGLPARELTQIEANSCRGVHRSQGSTIASGFLKKVPKKLEAAKALEVTD